MRSRVGFWVATAMSVAAAVVLTVADGGGSVAQAAVTPAIHAVPVLSSYENATRVISRDVGISVALPDGHDLWLFGDTGVFQKSSTGDWTEPGFIDGSTALQARYTRGQVPHGGETPLGKPSRFIPVPTDVYLTDGSGRLCTQPFGTAAFPARWPTGAAVVQSDPAEVLVTYSEVCVTHPPTGGAAQTAEGWGYMLYNWRTHRIDLGPVDVFKPQRSGAPLGQSHGFGWPVFGNGQLTLFSSRCTNAFVVCSSGQVWATTMPATTEALDNPASYKPTLISTEGSSKWEPLTISVGRYSTGLRLVEMTSIAGTYKIFSAPNVHTKWHLEQSGTLPGCPTRTGFCFGLEGHPELSTATDVFVSYKDPDSGPGGHVVVSAVPG